MQAPPIQYARTADGVSIAYCTVGEGPALVYMPSVPYRHVGLLWTISPQDRREAQLLASAGRRWVMFDPVCLAGVVGRTPSAVEYYYP